MKWQTGLKLSFVLAVVVVVICATGGNSSARLQSGGLTPEQQRGQQIYLHGSTAAGRDMVATNGDSAEEMPAAYLACASCHGRDGAGKPEGGITPSNITWEALTRPYGATSPSGRSHPAYDAQLIKRAITLGIDAAGDKLHVLMPRYRLTYQDAEDLIAYLKVLGKSLDPGLSESHIRIGTTVITAGPFAEMSQSVKAVLAAYFDGLNQQGGVFNRRIVLQAVASIDGPEPRVKALRAAIDNEQPFALIGVFMAGAEEEFAALVKEKGVPLVGAFTLSPPVGLPPNPFAFYITAGLKDQCRVLATFAAERFPSPPPQAAIIYTNDLPTRAAVQAIKSRCAQAGWPAVEEVQAPAGEFNPEAVLKSLNSRATRVVFLLTPGDLQDTILEQAAKIGWRATYFIPGLLAGRKVMDITEDAAEQVFLSVSSLPSDQTTEALIEYRRMAETYYLPSSHVASQMQALAAAKTLVEGLKRVGRDASRQKLVDALEGMYQFKTGLTPPLTYNPNRRIGASGAYVAIIDKQAHRLVPVSKWIEPD
jgi:ABC-type branched-subunit amino acid transport system substrate-binding protein